MFRAPGAHGKQPPHHPPAPGLPLPARPPRRSPRTAPHRIPPPGRPAAPRPPPPPGLQPSTTNTSKQRRGQIRTRGSLPSASRVPAGFKPVSQGRRLPPRVSHGRGDNYGPLLPRGPKGPSSAGLSSLPSAPEPRFPGGHRPCPAAGQAEPSRTEPGRNSVERPGKGRLTCMCRVLWTARVLDWQKPFPHSWHLKGFSLEWIYLEGNPWGEQRCRRRVGPATPDSASPYSNPSPRHPHLLFLLFPITILCMVKLLGRFKTFAIIRIEA